MEAAFDNKQSHLVIYEQCLDMFEQDFFYNMLLLKNSGFDNVPETKNSTKCGLGVYKLRRIKQGPTNSEVGYLQRGKQVYA